MVHHLGALLTGTFNSGSFDIKPVVRSASPYSEPSLGLRRSMPQTQALVGPLEHHPACFARVYTLLAGICDSGSFDVEPLVEDVVISPLRGPRWVSRRSVPSFPIGR